MRRPGFGTAWRAAAVLLILVSPIAADVVGDRADAIVAAHREGDQKALAALARKYEPDRWEVAGELCERGEHDAALAWIGTISRLNAAHERLPEYIESRRDGPLVPDGRGKVIRAVLLARKGRREEALKRLDEISPPPRTILAVYVGLQRAGIFASLGRVEDASDVARAAADTAREIGWLRGAGYFYERAANYRGELGLPAPALEIWEQALEMHTATGYGRGAALARERCGYLKVLLGREEEGRALIEQALSTFRDLKDRGREATALISLSRYHQRRGEIDEAIERAREAVRALEGYPNTRHVVGAAVHLAELEAKRAGPRRQVEIYEGCLPQLEEIGDDRTLAKFLSHLAVAHDNLGEYRRALAALEESARLSEALGDDAGVARAHRGIASICYHSNDGEAAIRHAERSLELCRGIGDEHGIASSLLTLGTLRQKFERDPDVVRDYLERALAHFLESKDESLAALCLGRLGRVSRSVGDLDAALEFYERTVALDEKSGSGESLAAHEAWLAELHSLRKEPELADAALARGLAAARAAEAPVQEAVVLGYSAVVHYRRGEDGAALSEAREAATVLGRLGEQLEDWRAVGSRRDQTTVYAVGALAALRKGDAATALWFLEAGRSRTLLQALASRDALRSAVLPAELEESEAAAEARVGMATDAFRAAVASGVEERVAQARVRLERARREVTLAAARTQREARRAAGLLQPESLGAKELEELLGEEQAFVSYGLFEVSEIPCRRVLAVVVDGSGSRVVDLGNSDSIKRACASLRLDDPGFETDAAVQRLRTLLVDPLELDDSVETVLVSPAGPLCHLPFGVLLDRRVSHLPSATCYALLREEAGARGRGVLALGNPEYREKPAPETGPPGRAGELLKPLPGTEKEVEAISAETVLLGADATEAALREAGAKRRWRAVHLACHGLLDRERPIFSALALTPSGDDDGFLTVLDVLRLELPADLVVLSACDTGRGRVVTGEGVVGFTRAFMFAGAPRVIVSLWDVDDDATRELMVKFHELWREGDRPAAAALREAQEHVRSQERWRHPHYWAAWQLWGLPD